jgi:hypothetical protein
MNNNKLDEEINRLISLNEHNKESRKAILYSLVAVWLKYDKKYSNFCEFCESAIGGEKNNLINFNVNAGVDYECFMTSRHNEANEATDASQYKEQEAATNAASYAVIAAYKSEENEEALAAAQKAVERAAAARKQAQVAIFSAVDEALKKAGTEISYSCNLYATLYYLIAAYLYLIY